MCVEMRCSAPLLFSLKRPNVPLTTFHQTSICAKLAKMTSLALVLVFCAFVSLSESACFFKHLKQESKYCVDAYDKSKHPMESTWINGRCIRCICSPGQMQCCDAMARVTNMSEGCIVKYDYKTCTFKVFHPKDSTIKCSYGAVGK